MPILALYDTTEIQNYVYGSSKLKDNIGASHLVEECFSKYLIEVIKDEFKDKHCKVNWRDYDDVEIIDNDNIYAEVIYIGGGNALVSFRNEDNWKKVNRRFSEILIREIPNLQFVTSYVLITGNFKEDINQLFYKIKSNKNKGTGINRFNGISITRECYITKAPATHKDDNDSNMYMSSEVYMKRRRANLSINDKKDKYDHYKDIDKLAGKKGESFVAIVHIDGNNIGKKIESILTENIGYKNAVHRMRIFSKNIQQIYEECYEEMLLEVEKFIEKNREDEIANSFIINGKTIAPFRKILINGDDITFICYGKYALSAIEKFYNKLTNKLEKYEYSDLSACAGVAFVKPHFPFNRAYEISEQCCANAKKVAKALCGEKSGNFIDFHVVRSGTNTELNLLREEIYNISYVKGAEKEYPIYNLLWRPYEISSSNKFKPYSYQLFLDILKNLNTNKIPRSKVKDLRNSFFYGEDELKANIDIINSRNDTKGKYDEIIKTIKAYNINLSSDSIFEEQYGNTPLFDALEMLDLYVEFKCEEV